MSNINRPLLDVKCNIQDTKCQIDRNILIYSCPNCGLLCVTSIGELACCIFRHGYDMVAKKQIPPHSSKKDCDNYSLNKNIYGCCRPYKIIKKGDSYFVAKCDYI